MTVGVVTSWNLPTLSDALKPGDLREIQVRISAGQFAADVRAANWAGHVVAAVLGLDPTDTGVKKRINALLAMWKKNGTLKTDTKHNPRTGRDQVLIVVGERV